MAGSARHVSRLLLHTVQGTTSLFLLPAPAPAADNISHSITLTLRAARHKSFTIKTSPSLHFSFSYAKNTSEPLTKHLKHESGHRELNGMIEGAREGGGVAGTAGGASRELEDRPAPFNNRQTVARFSSAALLLVLPCCDVYFWASHVLARLFFWLNVWPIRAEPRQGIHKFPCEC